jgi:hypothetical protein
MQFKGSTTGWSPTTNTSCFGLKVHNWVKIPKEIIRDIFYLSIYLYIYIWLYIPLLNLGRFFSFLILYTVGGFPWTGDQPVARLLLESRITQTQNKRTQTSMPWVGFEPTIPALQRATKVRALDSAATEIGIRDILVHVNYLWSFSYKINVDPLFKWWQSVVGDFLVSLALFIFQGKLTTQ